MLLAIAAAAVGSKPIPNVTSSFCDTNADFQLDKSGALLGQNFSYRLCMDVGTNSNSMICTKGRPCPAGNDIAQSVFTGGFLYTVTHSGACTKKTCPNNSCDAPNGIPFSFIIIDGADGNTNRGVATYQGIAEIDGRPMDHFAHDRGKVVPGLGIMNWYLVGNDLMRNSYVEPANGPNAGASGNRDFSKDRVVPAPGQNLPL